MPLLLRQQQVRRDKRSSRILITHDPRTGRKIILATVGAPQPCQGDIPHYKRANREKQNTATKAQIQGTPEWI